MRYYHYRSSFSDSHGYAQLTRFLPESVQKHFEQRTTAPFEEGESSDDEGDLATDVTSESVRRRTKDLWS